MRPCICRFIYLCMVAELIGELGIYLVALLVVFWPVVLTGIISAASAGWIQRHRSRKAKVIGKWSKLVEKFRKVEKQRKLFSSLESQHRQEGPCETVEVMATNGMTIEDLAAQIQQLGSMLNQSQQQNAQLQTQVTQLTQSQQDAQAQNVQLQDQVNQLNQAQQTTAATTQQAVQQLQGASQVTVAELGQVFASITQSQKELADAMKLTTGKKFQLIDTKGLAKPDKFSGSEENFLYWRTRIESFLVAAVPELEEVLEWAEEFDTEINRADVVAAWGDLNPSHKTVEGIEQLDAQVYALLQTLCEREAFSIVRSSGKNRGFESWRKLLRRFDPTTGGRRRAMLRHILNPNKITKIEELSAALEQWEELVRQYESRKKADGTRHQLDEEIKVSVLEHLCPPEIERHLQLNRTRYSNYTDVRQELVTYLETKLGSKIKNFTLTGGDNGGPQPMDVGAFEKGGKSKGKHKGKKGDGKKGNSKGKGGKGSPKGKGGKNSGGSGGSGKGSKETRACHNCGKTGHLQKDCWSAGGGSANKGQKPKAAPKSKGGKGVSNLEENEPEAETAETGFLSIAMLEEWTEDDVKQEPTGEDASGDMVTVPVEPGQFMMVKPEVVECSEPCDGCFHFKCKQSTENSHRIHECHVCAEDREKLVEAAVRKKAGKETIRAEVKWRRPESFHYLVDKTICLVKGITQGTFHNMSEEEKDKLRSIHDPLNISRDENPESLRKIEKAREGLRIKFFERLTGQLLEGASRTFGLRPTPGEDEPSRASSSAGPSIPSRPVGAASSQMMHRTVEMLEVGEIDERKKILKEKIRENDKQVKEKRSEGSFKLTPENVNDQSWHDSRYHQAVKAGVSHSKAWADEKKRRKATLHRKIGAKERAEERLRLDQEWHKEFDSKKVKDEEYHDETLGGIETEAVVEEDTGKMRVLTGKAKQVRRGQLKRKDAGVFVKSARSYRKLSQDEVEKFRTETKEDEKKVMDKKRVNIFKARNRVMTKDKKEKRSFRVKEAKRRKAKKEKDESSKVKYSDNFYLQHPHGEMMCADFKRSYCKRGAKCHMGHSEVDREVDFIYRRCWKMEQQAKKVVLVEKKQEINSFEGIADGEDHYEGWTKLVVNFDTGAAITAVPKELEDKGLLKSDKDTMSRSYKTASGELLEDEGGVVVQGYDSKGYGRSVEGRLVNVHRMLASGSAVTKKNTVLLSGNQGWIVPKDGKIAKGLKASFQDLLKRHPEEAKQLTQLYEHKGIFCFDLWLHGSAKDKGFSGSRDLAAVGDEVDFRRQAKL